MPKYSHPHCSSLLLLLCLISQPVLAAEKATAYQAALDTIVAQEMGQTVDDLAGPEFEGREAGSPGGRAAGDYLAEQLRKLPLKPAGKMQGYFQPFGNNYRNILALLPGSDPSLKDQTIVVGAHYDHLGHGRPRDNNPPGTIYPGADDNASGTSGVLELARAFSSMPIAPRRSILFVCFDGEEKGLLGSRHWTADPTLPLSRVKFMLNMDMIGSLRAQRVLVFGSRTASGLRRMASMSNRDSGLTLDLPDTVIVSHVAAGSAAAASGLQVGDRIYRVGGRGFADDTAFARLARTLPGSLELLVERDGRLRTVVLHFPQESGRNKKTA